MAETNYPLLLFPEPTHAERARRFGGGGNLRLPAASQQAERLGPQFQRLQSTMESQRLIVQNNPYGLQPEQVLLSTVKYSDIE